MPEELGASINQGKEGWMVGVDKSVLMIEDWTRGRMRGSRCSVAELGSTLEFQNLFPWPLSVPRECLILGMLPGSPCLCRRLGEWDELMEGFLRNGDHSRFPAIDESRGIDSQEQLETCGSAFSLLVVLTGAALALAECACWC